MWDTIPNFEAVRGTSIISSVCIEVLTSSNVPLSPNTYRYMKKPTSDTIQCTSMQTLTLKSSKQLIIVFDQPFVPWEESCRWFDGKWIWDLLVVPILGGRRSRRNKAVVMWTNILTTVTAFSNKKTTNTDSRRYRSCDYPTDEAPAQMMRISQTKHNRRTIIKKSASCINHGA